MSLDLAAGRVGVRENADTASAVPPFLGKNSQLGHKKGGLSATRTCRHVNAIHAFENFLARIIPFHSIKCVNRKPQEAGSPINIFIRDRWCLEFFFLTHCRLRPRGVRHQLRLSHARWP